MFTTSSNPFVGPARMDGSDVLWSLPRNLPPLVHPPFIEKGLKLGVGGRYLSECVAHQRGYMIHDNNGTLEIRIPFGAEGGFIKVSQRSYALSVLLRCLFFLYPNINTLNLVSLFPSVRVTRLMDITLSHILWTSSCYVNGRIQCGV